MRLVAATVAVMLPVVDAPLNDFKWAKGLKQNIQILLLRAYLPRTYGIVWVPIAEKFAASGKLSSRISASWNNYMHSAANASCSKVSLLEMVQSYGINDASRRQFPIFFFLGGKKRAS